MLKIQDDARQESLRVLAGGIARELNALLAVIMGNATLALSDAPRESPYRDALNAVMNASQRAADRTRQMLEYSCKGQLPDKALNSPFDLIFCDLVFAALKAGRQSGERQRLDRDAKKAPSKVRARADLHPSRGKGRFKGNVPPLLM
jgi:signal transduction histidine kinase